MAEKERTGLSRDRVLQAAVALADEIGIEALTIRKLATHLEVGPMTLYHYVSSKDAIVDGMVEIVFSEIELPRDDLNWKEAMRRRCVSARQVLRRHSWAAPLMESRTAPGAANLRHHDEVIGVLRRGGLSLQMTAHAYAILDSFIYGFAFEESVLPAGGGEGFAEIAEEMAAQMFGAYPNLAELTVDHVMQPGYAFGASFEFGLDLILEGLDRAARAAEG